MRSRMAGFFGKLSKWEDLEWSFIVIVSQLHRGCLLHQLVHGELTMWTELLSISATLMGRSSCGADQF